MLVQGRRDHEWACLHSPLELSNQARVVDHAVVRIVTAAPVTPFPPILVLACSSCFILFRIPSEGGLATASCMRARQRRPFCDDRVVDACKISREAIRRSALKVQNDDTDVVPGSNRKAEKSQVMVRILRPGRAGEIKKIPQETNQKHSPCGLVDN